MADYHPLIARAVAGLEKNTGDARRALYERARTALVAQLRGVTPALNESDITRERLALEEAIRKVEAESARQTMVEPARPETTKMVRPPEMPRWDDLRSAVDAERSTPSEADGSPRRSSVAPRKSKAGVESDDNSGSERQADSTSGQPIADAQPTTQRHPLRGRAPGERRSLLDAGLSKIRNVVSETNELGDASARSAKSVREHYGDRPQPAPESDHHKLGMLHGGQETLHDGPAPHLLEPTIDDETRTASGRFEMPQHATTAGVKSVSGMSWRDYIGLAAALLIVIGLGIVVMLMWPTLSQSLSQLYGSLRSATPTEVASDATAPARVKNPERFEPSGQPTQPAQTPVVAPVAAVAQRVVLYEEVPGDPQGKSFAGSAIWRTESVSPGPGLPPELAIRADVEIPERRIAMTWSLRRNSDPNLPASHTVEIVFKLPQDFSAGGVSNVPGILMKQAEQTRGTALVGLAVKVTNGFFLIGLSAVESDREKNLQLLKERAWFDIPVVYNNNRRAILALEKGTPGERAFAEAFRAWRQ